MPTPNPGLRISELSAQAGPFTLGPVSLAIPPDRVLVVLGPSGAGKTMLLETIAGLRPLQGGQISLAGTDITGLAPERRRIGLVFQDAALFPHLTVTDNIRFGPRASHRTSPDGTSDLLNQLGIAHLADRAPRSLSGGERQRVALARALAIQPGLLLLDEPLSALDQPTREDMRALLQRLLTELEIPAAHVTHDRDEALSIGDDLAIIVGGQLRQTGPAAQRRRRTSRPATSPACSAGPNSDTARHRKRHHPHRAPRFHDAAPRACPAQYKPSTGPKTSNSAPHEPDTDRRQPHGTGRPDRPHTATRPHQHGLRPAHHSTMLHRDIDRHRLTAGDRYRPALPPSSLRVFQAH